MAKPIEEVSAHDEQMSAMKRRMKSMAEEMNSMADSMGGEEEAEVPSFEKLEKPLVKPEGMKKEKPAF